jgi:ferredoxin
MRVNADRNICIGSGNCVLTAPEVFDQGEDGMVDLLDSHPGADREQIVRDAVTRCPSGAISLSERDPGP